MNKRAAFIFFTIIISATISPEIIATFEEPFQFPQIFIDDHQFYIVDQSDHRVHIFSIKNFEEIKVFGGRGEQPGKFSRGQYIQVCKDYIFGRSLEKIMYFNKKGDLMEEIKMPENLDLRVFPVEEEIAVTILEDPSNATKSTNLKCKVLLFSPKNNESKEVYEFNRWLTRTSSNSPRQNKPVIQAHTSLVSDGKNLIICAPEKGRFFYFINDQGKIVKQIKIPYEKRKITSADQKRMINNLKERYGVHWEEQLQRYNFVFPEYYPPYFRIKVDSSKIYVYTHFIEKGKRECIVYDYNGNFIKKLMLPSGNPSTIYKGKMYYLVEKKEHSELHRISI